MIDPIEDLSSGTFAILFETLKINCKGFESSIFVFDSAEHTEGDSSNLLIFFADAIKRNKSKQIGIKRNRVLIL